MQMELKKSDVKRIVERLPECLKLLMTDSAFIGKVSIAGGFIRSILANQDINDIDVFVSDLEVADKVCNFVMNNLAMNNLGNVRASYSENACTLYNVGFPIQIITKWLYNTPQEVIDDFDFTICQAAIFYHEIDGFIGICASLYGKELIFAHPVREHNPMVTLFRYLKFAKLGYYIESDSFFSLIAKAIKSLNIKGADLSDEYKVAEALESAFSEINEEDYD